MVNADESATIDVANDVGEQAAAEQPGPGPGGERSGSGRSRASSDRAASGGIPTFEHQTQDAPIQTPPIKTRKPRTATVAEQKPDLFAIPVTSLFGFVAAVRGEHWNLKPDEAGLISLTATDVFGQMVDKLPAKKMKYLNLGVSIATFGAVVIAVAGPRMAYDRVLKAQRAAYRWPEQTATPEQAPSNGYAEQPFTMEGSPDAGIETPAPYS